MKCSLFKSLIAMALSFALVLSFGACSSENSEKADSNSPADSKTNSDVSYNEKEDSYDESGLVEPNDNGNAKIMGLTVVSKEGIAVSANTKYFTESVKGSDILGFSDSEFRTYVGNENNIPDLIRAASSNMYVSGSLPRFFEGSIDDYGYAQATAVQSDVKSGYVAFDIFVKADKDTKVYWNNTELDCSGNEDTLSSMRLALVNCGVVSQNAEATEIKKALPANANENRVVMYEPNSKNHTEDSGYADGAVVPDYYISNEFSKLTLSGKRNNIVQSSQATSMAFGTRATDDTKSSNAYFNAEEGINRIRVYLWIEGNDVDCASDTKSELVNLKLVFSANP